MLSKIQFLFKTMGFFKKYIFVLFFLAFLVPSVVSAVDLNLIYPNFPGAPDINDPVNQTLSGTVAWLYTLIVGLSGFAAFIMIVWGGIEWMTSAGNPSKTSEAKDKIQKALLGLLLVLASFLILQVINSDLTLIREPSL